MRHASVLLAALLSISPAAALAQDEAADWVLTRVPAQNTVAAMLEFTSGVTLMARCTDGVYDLAIFGLPEAAGQRNARQLTIMMGEEARPRTTTWTVATDRTAAFSRIPAIVARDLAKGGKLQVVVPPEREGAPRTRYVMDLDTSGAAIEETLTACGRPLADPRRVADDAVEGNGQDGLPPTIAWVSPPRPEFPAPVFGRGPMAGYATLSCVANAEGRLNDCVKESELPAGSGFGDAVLRSMPRARIRPAAQEQASASPPERMVLFSVHFGARP